MIFESLSFRFGLTSDDPELGRRAEGLIGAFARPVDGDPPSVAYSIRAGDHYTLHRDDVQMTATGDRGALLSHLVWLISNDTAELAEGYVLVHAGAVVTPDGDGVVILGESGSGKTTLVAALVQEGFGYLSDEAAAINVDTSLVHPWPRQLGLGPESRSLPRFASLPAPELDGSRHVSIEQIRAGAISEPCRVRHVIDHCYRRGGATRIEPLSRAVALARMGSAAPRLRIEGERGLSALADMMRGADAHSLESNDLDRSVQVVRAL